ncbi:hypothetical protein AURDEDRAFT_140567 [Auricularia subglabra TFB-10046 SS5]|uniref:Uncharacterized protein n=1 Tax=Auricularia subglabra (strain TFB-10046 / SS5) TaxID=717982 RepID=J0LD25_AURST|nr:hypothetical protein AURDEDRAFT_140567 [Auricularia subglabra TFB-10046 SS5]
MATSRYTGPKLDSTNYYEWQNGALAHISSRGVFHLIEHPEGLRPQVGSVQSPDTLAAAKAAAERAGGIATVLTVPAPPPPGQPAGAGPGTATTTVRTWFVAVPDPVSRRVQSVTLAPPSMSQADYRDWCKEARIAVGVIWDTLGPAIQKDENAAYLMRSGDPFLLWAAIFRRVNPTTASALFTAMSSLMSVTWEDGWNLEQGHTAVTEKYHNYLDHRSPGMTADEVLDEVALFAFLSIVPPELDTFSPTVFINAGDRSVTLPDLLDVLQQEDQEDSLQSHRGQPHQNSYKARLALELAARAAAMRPAAAGASGATGAAGNAPRLSPREALAALQASRPSWTKCWLCFGDHLLDTCPYIARVQKYAKQLRETKNEDRRAPQAANLAGATGIDDERFPEASNCSSL